MTEFLVVMVAFVWFEIKSSENNNSSKLETFMPPVGSFLYKGKFKIHYY